MELLNNNVILKYLMDCLYSQRLSNVYFIQAKHPFIGKRLRLLDMWFDYDFSQVRVHTDTQAAESTWGSECVSLHGGKGCGVWGEAGSSSRGPRSLENSEPNNKQSNISNYGNYIRREVIAHTTLWTKYVQD